MTHLVELGQEACGRELLAVNGNGVAPLKLQVQVGGGVWGLLGAD